MKKDKHRHKWQAIIYGGECVQYWCTKCGCRHARINGKRLWDAERKRWQIEIPSERNPR